MSAATKRAKKKQGYEQHPPRCSNCRNFHPGQMGVPGLKKFMPSNCRLGLFAVNPVAICDEWTGRNGEKLES